MPFRLTVTGVRFLGLEGAFEEQLFNATRGIHLRTFVTRCSGASIIARSSEHGHSAGIAKEGDRDNWETSKRTFAGYSGGDGRLRFYCLGSH